MYRRRGGQWDGLLLDCMTGADRRQGAERCERFEGGTMSRPRVGLLVTCLVDFFRPEVGFASIRLLQAAGCEVVVPEIQTCCGQPAWNSGDRDSSRELALAILDAFDGFDAVVAPSGSCIGMLRQYPAVLGEDHPRHDDAVALAARAHELTSFLVDERGHHGAGPVAPMAGPVTYHDACSGLRELGVRDQPRTLLAAAGVSIQEMDGATVCCGFGGTFCIKYPEISGAMVDDKVASIERSGAATVVAGDLGCLLNIEGRLARLGKPIRARHVAEVLMGADDAVEKPA